MKTRSTDEAMSVLRRHRAALIEEARCIALDIAVREGSVHSRQVRDEMARRGRLGADKEFWLGAVFHSKYFEWTGEWVTYTDDTRNVHERTIKVWRAA